MYNLSSKLMKPVLLVSFVILFLSGCATKNVTEFKASVYPPEPAEPKFVFERTLMGSSDVQDLTSQERFKAMATGKKEPDRRMIKPYDVAVHKGRVYVSDTVQRSVIMFDIPGGRFEQFGHKGAGVLRKPTGVATSSQGDVFVTDVAARRVMVYDSKGSFLRSIGGKEELERPSGVAVSADSQYVYVVDTGGVESTSHHLVKYDAKTGELIKKIGKRSSKEGGFNLPGAVDVDPEGRVYVMDAGNFRVQRFSAEGQFEMAYGEVGNKLGNFSRPKGIATDQKGNVYAVDSSFSNFQIFNEKGQLLLFIGERSFRNEPGKFSLPAGIDVDEDGRIYVVDQFFSKIDVFRPYGMAKEDGYAGIKPPKKKNQ